jgi:hypothetical protein
MQFCAGLFTEVGEGWDYLTRSMRLKWSRTLYASFDGEFFIPLVGEQKKCVFHEHVAIKII